MAIQQQLPIDIMTDNPQDIIQYYPTLVDYYEDEIELCSLINYELSIVFRENKTLMIHTYYRERRQGLMYGSYYTFAFSEPLVTALLTTFRFYHTHSVFERIYYNEVVSKYNVKFIEWLWKSREQIVKEEMHPDKIRSLLENGVDLEDIESEIDSKLADKLSY